MSSVFVCMDLIRKPDAKWKKMKNAFDACEAAGVEPPKDVWEFFNHARPDDKGITIAVGDPKGTTWSEDDHTDGVVVSDYGGRIEIDVSKIPKNITHIRASLE